MQLFVMIRVEHVEVDRLLRSVEAVEKMTPKQSKELLRRLLAAVCHARQLNDLAQGVPPPVIGDAPEISSQTNPS